MKSFNKVIRVAPSTSNSLKAGEVRIATFDSDKYVNLSVGGSVTISPTEAMQLRDFLLEAFPLQPVAKPTKFKVGDKVTYKSIVGYGVRGMEGRKGSIKEVLANGWYSVNFSGGPFDQLIKTHEDYLVAEPRQFQAGDRVRRTGSSFSTVTKGEVYTVSGVDAYGALLLVGKTGRYTLNSFELVHADPVEAVKAAVPTIQSGRFIVAKLEGARYLPGTNPKVHVTDIGAEAEALRLAKEHGGTYHVFKATYEASRELPVIPPVKATKL